jgi:hypothetical protein
MKRHFFLLALLLLAFFLTPGYGQSFKSPRHYYLFQSGELKKIHQDPLSLAPQPDQWKFWFYTVGTNAVPNEQYWREIAKPTLPQLIAAIKAIQQSELKVNGGQPCSHYGEPTYFNYLGPIGVYFNANAGSAK